MDDKDLEIIEKRLQGALPTETEPAFGDEIWFIKHLEEVIKSYRQDTPLLIDEIKSLRAQLAEAQAQIERLELRGSRIESLLDQTSWEEFFRMEKEDENT